MRILLTAAGSIAKRHAINLLALAPATELIVVSRAPGARLADWPVDVRRVVQHVESFSQGLAKSPQAIMVCSASSQHASEVMHTIRSGLPVFVEKPLLTSTTDADQIQALLPQAHPASVVGCNLRFLPSLRRLKQALDEGIAGHLVRAHFEVGQWLPDWRPGRSLASSYSAQADTGGGVVFDLVHEIDAALWLLGDLTLVSALGGQLSQLPISAPDTAVALLRAAYGFPVTVSLDYVSRRPVRRYVMVGDAGTLVWDMQAGQLTLASQTGVEILCNSPAAFSVADTYPAELAEWLAAVDGKALPSTCALIGAMPTARLMLAISTGLV